MFLEIEITSGEYSISTDKSKLNIELVHDFLSKSYWGRNFIKLYYKYSPLLVEKLKDKTKTNDIIRTLLDQLIKIIR